MAGDKDIAVGAIGALGSTISGIPTGPAAKVAPSYLVKLMPDMSEKAKKYKMFIAVEQPQFMVDHIHTKGFFSELCEDDIVVTYREVVAQTTASDILEMWIPWHVIHSVRSLVFKTSSKK